MQSLAYISCTVREGVAVNWMNAAIGSQIVLFLYFQITEWVILVPLE